VRGKPWGGCLVRRGGEGKERAFPPHLSLERGKKDKTISLLLSPLGCNVSGGEEEE